MWRDFHWVCLCTVLILAPLSDAAAQDDPVLTVREAVWTPAVKERQYTTRLVGETKNAPLYLWTRLEGDNAALAMLEKEGKLPILHVWKRYVAHTKDGPEMIEPENEHQISLGIGGQQGKIIEDIKNEIALRGGRFDWRTWSTPLSVQPGKWIVDVTYSDRQPVYCGGSICQYVINVVSARSR